MQPIESSAEGRLLDLVRIAVGTRDAFASPPASAEEWKDLLKQVAGHGLVGVTFPAVEKLGRTTGVPIEASFPWQKAVARIRQRNSLQAEAVARLHTFFQEAGFGSCLLKGPAAAALYPDPSLRQSGDIDIWTNGGRRDVIAYLQANYPINEVVYHHCDPKIFKQIEVEVHFTPTWMFSPFANRRLQRWFAAKAPEQFSHYDESLGINVPTPAFNGVYLMLHIYRHLLAEGVGLRQLMDYYHLLHHLDGAGREAVVQDLRHLRLYKFSGTVMYVLQEVFLLDASRMLCPPDARSGALLLRSILQSGNFGQFDPAFANGKGKAHGKLVHGWLKLRRNLRFLSICPSEVLWMPWFLTWQYFWRLRHGYLEKKH